MSMRSLFRFFGKMICTAFVLAMAYTFVLVALHYTTVSLMPTFGPMPDGAPGPFNDVLMTLWLIGVAAAVIYGAVTNMKHLDHTQAFTAGPQDITLSNPGRIVAVNGRAYLIVHEQVRFRPPMNSGQPYPHNIVPAKIVTLTTTMSFEQSVISITSISSERAWLVYDPLRPDFGPIGIATDRTGRVLMFSIEAVAADICIPSNIPF